MRAFRTPLCLLLPLVVSLGCARNELAPPPGAAYAPAVAPAGDLHSPWEATPVALSDQPYNCGPIKAISPDITVTTSQNSLSPQVRQAIYAESDVALHELSGRSVAAADNFRHTGSRAAAGCVFALLATAAHGHAMAGYMATDDAWQEQNTALRAVSIAYLKVRDSGIGRAYDEGVIDAWLDDVARKERDRMLSGPCGQKFCDLRGHRGLSVAAAAASVGVAANDRELYAWALKQYKDAVRNIDGRGMLHYDTHGLYALKFNIVSAGALVQIAELGETNGEAMYAYNDGQIHLLIHSVSRGLIDPNPFSNAAGAEQKIAKKIEPWEVSWAAVYDRRFPDPVLTTLLAQVGSRGADMWGGESGI